MSDLGSAADSPVTDVPSFEAEIKPLFRELDRLDMLYQFDLWAYDEVVENAANILMRVEDRTMPCDEPWSDDKIERFRAWLEGGCPK